MSGWDYAVILSIVGATIALGTLLWLDRPRKYEPPAVPVSPELLRQYREEVIHLAMQQPKRKLRAGQSRRPL